MVVAKPLRPGRPQRRHPLAHARPHLELGAVALAIVEADGLDPHEALERPGEADGRVLPAGKQHKRGVGGHVNHRSTQSHFGEPEKA